ncbi:MAG: hypothetical protein ACLT98_05510 [Eggerthellaceae bacterium]
MSKSLRRQFIRAFCTSFRMTPICSGWALQRMLSREPVHALLAPARARLDIFEATTGGRVILSAVCIGGVNRDIENTELKAIVDKLNGIKDEYREITNTFLKNTSVKAPRRRYPN